MGLVAHNNMQLFVITASIVLGAQLTIASAKGFHIISAIESCRFASGIK